MTGWNAKISQNQSDIDHQCIVEYEKIKLQNRRHTKETVITCDGKYQGHAGIIYWLTASLPHCRAIMHVSANSNVNSTSRNWPRSWNQHLKAKVESLKFPPMNSPRALDSVPWRVWKFPWHGHQGRPLRSSPQALRWAFHSGGPFRTRTRWTCIGLPRWC